MTGIICAMQIEADGIIALSQNTQTEEIAGMKFTTGTLHGKDIAVVVCGVGKVNAAMCAVVLIEKYNPEVVINSGVGGSLSPLVSIGDIVVATKSVQHDMNTTALGDKQGEVSFPDGTKMFFDCDKTVVKKLTQACKTLPDTKVEQGGRNFSGGQRQRLCIARAIVGDPEQLILDDSFSALDFATDAALRKALSKRKGESTVIIVTQRCSTIKNADLILVLSDGELAGAGTHDELFENCSVYREICLSQLSDKEADAK